MKIFEDGQILSTGSVYTIIFVVYDEWVYNSAPKLPN